MKPRFYVHMGPKSADKVSWIWKVGHIAIFILLLCSSSVATVCIYNILDMYNFHCILYARVSFEQTQEQRFEIKNETGQTNAGSESETQSNDTEALSTTTDKPPKKREVSDDNDAANVKRLEEAISLADCRQDWKKHPGHYRYENSKQRSAHINNAGFLNMRKTIFATIYMCDLLLFAPLLSLIVAIFLGVLIGVGGKGGAGNPGDLLPNPWIFVYPFLGLCAFMIIFSFISDNLYHKGLSAFCLTYLPLTKKKGCSEELDRYNVQFSPGMKGPRRSFYMNYVVGSVAVQLTSAFWVIQTLFYLLRILCLADFSVYLTRIRSKDDENRQELKMAGVVMKAMDDKSN